MGRSDRLFMLRSRLPGPVSAVLAVALAAAATLPALAQQPGPVAIPAAPAATGARTEVNARQAAERILRVLQQRDANARFAQFAPELQRVTSPSMIAQTMKNQPQLLSWTITSVQPGHDSSTVEATLREVVRCTRDGIRINTFVLDATSALEAFIEQMTRLNGGRAFYTTNEALGDYVLVDFLERRRRATYRRVG